MTEPAGDDNTAAAPRHHDDRETTVVPNAAAADAADALAWSDSDPFGPDVERRTWRSTIARATVLIAVACAIAAGVAGWALLRHTGHAPPAARPSSPMPAPLPTAPPFDGTYRVDFDYAHAVLTANVPMSADPNAVMGHSFWAFRSACTPAGCFATGTRLDATQNHATDQTTILRFVGSRWIDEQPQRHRDKCPRLDKSQGFQSGLASWTFTAQPDGTLVGSYSNTVETNECGMQGDRAEVRLSATRIGSVPAGVEVADPAAVR
jgi:serine/threonine protein kinase, bacterial